MRRRVPRIAARAVAMSCCWPMVRLESGAAAGKLEAEIVEDRLRLANHGAVLQEAEAPSLLAEEHVGGDGQVRAEHDLLMHGVDAALDGVVRRREDDGPAFPEYLAGGRRDDAGEELDEGRLAGAVLTDDGVDLARLEGEIRRLQRMRAGDSASRARASREAAPRRRAASPAARRAQITNPDTRAPPLRERGRLS